jgi:diphosphomevalonate decarboxylase
MIREVLCRTSPSLALVKYWGKKSSRQNLPATPSLAVTLGGVHTETRVRIAGRDSIRLNGEPVALDRFTPLF